MAEEIKIFDENYSTGEKQQKQQEKLKQKFKDSKQY